MLMQKNRKITFEDETHGGVSVSSCCVTWTLLPEGSDSEGVGDWEFASRNKTARLVSSSSFSTSSDGLTFPTSWRGQGRWRLLAEESWGDREQKSKSSKKAHLGVQRLDAGLSGEGSSAFKVFLSRNKASEIWLFISKLSMRESKLSSAGCCSPCGTFTAVWLSAVKWMLRMLTALCEEITEEELPVCSDCWRPEAGLQGGSL